MYFIKTPRGPNPAQLIRRFYVYAFLRNLRFFDAFFVLFLVLELELSFTVVGFVIAYEKAIVGLLEVPLAVVSDRIGRRRALMASFSLASTAFIVFGYAGECSTPLAIVLLGQTIYGCAESLRTGTHKAIALDWLSLHQLGKERVRVLSQMRFFSKASAGLAALLAGGTVWWTGAISPLFWIALIPTLGAVALVFSYPPECEGQIQRQRRAVADREQPSLRRGLVHQPTWALMLPSIIFESQIKLAVLYLQPALAEASKEADLLVMGGIGALIIGLYMGALGILAGSASLVSPHLIGWCGTIGRALVAIHIAAAILVTAACLAFLLNQQWFGIAVMIAVASFQNARRPLFVAAMDKVMVPEYRSTILSVESQGRSWLYAGASIVVGWTADALGLAVAFALISALLWAAGVLSMRRSADRSGAETT